MNNVRLINIGCDPDSPIIWYNGSDWRQEGHYMRHMPTDYVFEVRLKKKDEPFFLFSYAADVITGDHLEDDEAVKLGRAAIAISLMKKHPTPVLWFKPPWECRPS